MTSAEKHKLRPEQPANPYDEASVLSKVFFWWLNPFIKLGFRKNLELADLYRVPRENLSEHLGGQLHLQWDRELAHAKAGGQPSLPRALWRAFGLWYMLAGIWVTLGECIVRILQAVSLGRLVRHVNQYLVLLEEPATAGQAAQLDQLYYSAIYDGLWLIFFSIIALITVHPYVFCTQHTGMKVRVACCHLIYRHALTLSNAAIGQTTVGQMVNLLTNDVNRFDIALNYIQYLVIAPLQAVIAIAVLSTMYLGFYATAAGSCLLLLYVPFQSLMGRWFGRLRLATATRTDERIRLMNEIIPAMRVIKMYTWEDPFAKLVELARKNEVRLIRYTSVLRAINMALFFVSSKIILFISFITYVLLGFTLDPEIVFVAITLFNTVRLLMTLFFSYGVSQLAEMWISCNRLQEFLLLPQQDKSNRIDRLNENAGDLGHEKSLKPDEIKIESADVSANWTIINKTFQLPLDDASGAGVRKADELAALSYNSNKKPKVIASNADRPRADSHSQARLGALDSSSRSSLFASTANVHLSGRQRSGIVEAAGDQLNQTAITALRNVSYQVKGGELMIIVGRVGSGKSSVLMSILGELPISSGRLSIRGRISYSSQEAWIFAGSVRDNVLFGRPYDAARYQEVLRVCSLDRDIKLFPYGDQTIVGERGVSLSGGQRARINLARAIYREADIYLLDDPLSAVDTVVAKHIFNQCICGFLKDKAVLLATHQTQFVRKDTRVLFLQDGRQISCKNYADNKDLQLFIGSAWEKSDSESALSSAKQRAPERPLRRSPAARASDNVQRQLAVADEQQQGDEQQQKEKQKQKSQQEDKQPLLGHADEPSSSGSGSGSASPGAGASSDSDEPQGERVLGPKEPQADRGAESAANSVNAKMYWYYVKSCQALYLVFIVTISNAGTQILFNGTDFWLSYWTDTEQRKAANGGSTDYPPVTLTDTLTLNQNALVYTILIAALFLLTLIRTTCFFVACTRSSINLHNRLFESVIKAPIKFFDYNPIGILLNRVSRDMGIVDDLLPPTAFDTIEIFVNVFGTLVTVAIIYPLNALPAIVLCSIVAIIRLLYMRTVRSIKTIEGVTRSPVFTHLATSLQGLATIRAFRVEPEFERRFDDYQDVHSSAWFLFVASSRWLGVSLDWLSLCYIAAITLVMTLTLGSTTGSQIGLAISSALFLSGSFQWGVRQSTELESQMTSVGRIKEYSELPEEPARYSALPPPADWPQRGAIEFRSVSLRYFDNEEPVLKELDFRVKAGEKIGIVGRTGAGKSSIIAVLFRLTEPEGSVLIDGIDTKSIGLHELRQKLSIIPQEPILFNGPIRRNLDPFSEYEDADLWRALEHVKLAEVVRSLPGALDAELKEGGSNFSVGERQLICLARAVLRQNRIILLDEATANVDPDTDKFIQRTIADSFTQCTRLTIAHRLNTIMDSDRVLVMDAGRVREFDAPHLLLQKEGGAFWTMVKNTGKNAGHLRRLAKNYYERRQQVEKK